MASNKQGLRIPWWIYLLLAICSYYLLKHGLFIPNSTGDEEQPVLGLIAKGAPLAAIVFLLLAANALYNNNPPDNDNPPQENKDQ